MSAFLGGLLGSAFSRPLTRVARRGGRTLLWLTLGAVLVAVGWFRAQPLWVQVLVVLLAALLLAGWVGRRVERRRATEPVRREPPTALYRWFDEHGELMYVGISNDLERRTGEHAAEKPWMRPGVTCTTVMYPTRAEALAAEEWAIKTERPIWNKIHNGGWA